MSEGSKRQVFNAENSPLDIPVHVVNTGFAHDQPDVPEPGVAISLSGRGYRATLFHLGALPGLLGGGASEGYWERVQHEVSGVRQ